MNGKEFEYGDKVYIHCLGRWNGATGKVRGKVYDEESGMFLHGYYVDLNFDTPEPYTEVFAEEHLELVVGPEEEEKAGQIKDSGERTEINEFIFEIPFTHIESIAFGNNSLQIKCKTSKKELNGEEK